MAAGMSCTHVKFDFFVREYHRILITAIAGNKILEPNRFEKRTMESGKNLFDASKKHAAIMKKAKERLGLK